MKKIDMNVYQVLYLEESCGVPQIGHYVQNPARPTDWTYFPNRGTEDMSEIADKYGFNLIFRGNTGFVGGFPASLTN